MGLEAPEHQSQRVCVPLVTSRRLVIRDPDLPRATPAVSGRVGSFCPVPRPSSLSCVDWEPWSFP